MLAHQSNVIYRARRANCYIFRKRADVPESFNRIHLGEREMRMIARRRRFYDEIREPRTMLPPVEEDPAMSLTIHRRPGQTTPPPAFVKREPDY